MTRPPLRCFALLACSLCLSPVLRAGDDWPDFRGPQGDGRGVAADLPVRWSEAEHVRWKVELPGRGWSSPVIQGQQIWMTTAQAQGRRLLAICVNRQSGHLEHLVRVFDVESPEPINDLNSYASPSPVIEAGRVYVHFGSSGTACLSTDEGRVVWSRRDLNLNHKEGAGSSPVLYGELLIFPCDGMDVQYLVALDKRSGATVWKTSRSAPLGELRPDFRKAYSTPLVVERPAGAVLVSTAAQMAAAYEPLSGREVWKVRYQGFSNVSRPVTLGDRVLINTGYMRPRLMSVRLGGRGDVTDSHVEWSWDRGVPAKPSPVVVDGLVYFVSDKGGVLTCLDGATGEAVWSERLGGNFSASPIHAAGRLYFCDQDGQTHVVRPGRTFDRLAVNSLDDGCMASPAVAGRALFLRTRSHLYRLEQR